MSTCSMYNESELNHYGMCRTYKLSKDKSVMLTQYVTKEKLRAERAEARVKELESAFVYGNATETHLNLVDLIVEKNT